MLAPAQVRERGKRIEQGRLTVKASIAVIPDVFVALELIGAYLDLAHSVGLG
jgi:hypothetical protein